MREPAPRIARPAGPPPFPPDEFLLRRRRIGRAAGFVAAVFLGAVTVLAARDEAPAARGRTGLDLPGLEESATDAALARAPESVFNPLEWSLPSQIVYDEANPESAAVPAALEDLEGKPVRVEGFMLPLDLGEVTRDFVVVPDMGRCYFCEPPDPARSIYVRSVPDPVPAEYDRPVKVMGVIAVGPVVHDGRLHSLLRIRAVRVEPL